MTAYAFDIYRPGITMMLPLTGVTKKIVFVQNYSSTVRGYYIATLSVTNFVICVEKVVKHLHMNSARLKHISSFAHRRTYFKSISCSPDRLYDRNERIQHPCDQYGQSHATRRIVHTAGAAS